MSHLPDSDNESNSSYHSTGTRKSILVDNEKEDYSDIREVTIHRKGKFPIPVLKNGKSVTQNLMLGNKIVYKNGHPILVQQSVVEIMLTGTPKYLDIKLDVESTIKSYKNADKSTVSIEKINADGIKSEIADRINLAIYDKKFGYWTIYIHNLFTRDLTKAQAELQFETVHVDYFLSIISKKLSSGAKKNIFKHYQLQWKLIDLIRKKDDGKLKVEFSQPRVQKTTVNAVDNNRQTYWYDCDPKADLKYPSPQDDDEKGYIPDKPTMPKYKVISTQDDTINDDVEPPDNTDSCCIVM